MDVAADAVAELIVGTRSPAAYADGAVGDLTAHADHKLLLVDRVEVVGAANGHDAQ